MNRRLSALPLLMCSILPSLPAQEEGTRWLDNYQAALAEARSTGKPIFLEFRCEP